MLEQNGVKYGAIAGLGLIIITLVLYLIDVKVMFSYTSLIGWVVYIYCMYKSVADDKAADGGFITFRNAFQSSFVVFVIASLLNTIFFYVLTTIIDPSLIDMQILGVLGYYVYSIFHSYWLKFFNVLLRLKLRLSLFPTV